MEFYKETIMGQVLTQVQSNINNDIYFNKIDDLLEEIDTYGYLDAITKPWQRNGLFITDKDITTFDNDPEWIYVETADVIEYSWLVEKLVQVYKPQIVDIYRLLTTIGYLLNVYGEKNDDLSDILRFTSITSTVFLHPDHIGRDRFKIYPMTLPPFGKEF